MKILAEGGLCSIEVQSQLPSMQAFGLQGCCLCRRWLTLASVGGLNWAGTMDTLTVSTNYTREGTRGQLEEVELMRVSSSVVIRTLHIWQQLSWRTRSPLKTP